MNVFQSLVLSGPISGLKNGGSHHASVWEAEGELLTASGYERGIGIVQALRQHNMNSIALVEAIGRHRGTTGRHEGAGTGQGVRNTLTISVELSSY